MKAYHLIFLITIYWMIFLSHGTLVYGQDTHVVRWDDDIDYLIEHLKIMHPNLYANISRETFLDYAAQLKQRIPTSTDVEMIFGIQELVARIRNTHTFCGPLLYMNFLEALKKQFRYYPVY
jgi:argininosuccinate synthase